VLVERRKVSHESEMPLLEVLLKT